MIYIIISIGCFILIWSTIIYYVGKKAGKNKYDIIQNKEQIKTLYDSNRINAENNAYIDADIDKWLRSRARKSS